MKQYLAEKLHRPLGDGIHYMVVYCLPLLGFGFSGHFKRLNCCLIWEFFTETSGSLENRDQIIMDFSKIKFVLECLGQAFLMAITLLCFLKLLTFDLQLLPNQDIIGIH